MLTKRTLVVLLVVANLILGAALLTSTTSLPPAFAQAGLRSGEFLCVTAKPSGQSYDVLYVLDVPSRQLHAFYPGLPQSKNLTQAQPRDLSKDFGLQAGP